MIPAEQSKRFVPIFEAAKRSLLVYERTYTRLWKTLRDAEPVILVHGNVDEGTQEALIDAITLVDFAHRFAELMQELPGIPKRGAEMRALEREAAIVESARHHLQHMRGDLKHPDALKFPILGSLAWANGDSSSFVISFSQDRAEQMSLVYDAHERKWVRQIQYTVRDIAVDFDEVRNVMHRAYGWLISGIETTPPDFKDLKWAPTFAGHFAIENGALG